MPFVQNFPRSFVASSIREFAPPASGVYGITNAAEWIYIGVADNIQMALMEHLQGAHASVLQRVPTGFVYEICDHAKRDMRQDRLITEYKPVCNHRSSVTR